EVGVKHPEVLLLPVLMFVDYFMTVLGAVQRDKKYSHHFKVRHYELNPIWQTAIAQRKWFNVRHAVMVLVVSAILIGGLELGDVPDGFARAALGALIVAY